MVTPLKAKLFSFQNYRNTIISIRTTSPHPAIRFIPAFKKEMSAPLRIGNYYLGGLDPFTWIAKDMNYKVGVTNNARIRTALMIFLFINIMLCVFGTFWYRVHVRREEIGIRLILQAGSNRWIHYEMNDHPSTCVASQKGLFSLLPQQHKVTRFRTG